MKIIIALLLLMIPLQSHAQAKKEDWPIGSARHAIFVHQEKINYFLDFLTKDQIRLEELIRTRGSNTSALLRALQNQHKSWLLYYPSECALMGALSGTGGAWPSAHALRCQANLVNNRLVSVRNSIACINRQKQERVSVNDISNCLYQLGPLTTE